MHKSTRTAVIFLLTWTLLSPVIGQTNAQPVQMADAMRSDGKIYVVIAVILTILAGLLAYLISLDRRISRFEKNID
jgi:MFS superfamily sulfate permease-like transporter